MRKCTSADLYEEIQFAKRFQARFPKARLEKLSDWQKLDFAVLSSVTGWVGGFVEFKRRGCGFDDYGSAFLNSQKWVSMRELHLATGLPCWLALGYDDGDYMYKFRPDDRFPIAYLPTYKEAVISLPLDRFFPLVVGPDDRPMICDDAGPSAAL